MPERYVLRLFVAGATPGSARAVEDTTCVTTTIQSTMLRRPARSRFIAFYMYMNWSSQAVTQLPRTNSHVRPAPLSNARHPLGDGPACNTADQRFTAVRGLCNLVCGDARATARRCVSSQNGTAVPARVPVQVLSGASQKLHGELRPPARLPAVARPAAPRTPTTRPTQAPTTHRRRRRGDRFHDGAAAGRMLGAAKTARARGSAPQPYHRGCPRCGHNPRATAHARSAPETSDARRLRAPRSCVQPRDREVRSGSCGRRIVPGRPPASRRPQIAGHAWS